MLPPPAHPKWFNPFLKCRFRFETNVSLIALNAFINNINSINALKYRWNCRRLRYFKGVLTHKTTNLPSKSKYNQRNYDAWLPWQIPRHQVFVNCQLKLSLRRTKKAITTLTSFARLFLFKNVVVSILRSRERLSKIKLIQTWVFFINMVTMLWLAGVHFVLFCPEKGCHWACASVT